MKLGQSLLIILLSIVLSSGVAYHLSGGGWGEGASRQAGKETRLEQVKRTGILRCGYAVWPPFFTKDPNNGKMGGPFYDLVKEMGRQLKLKIEWTTEVSMGEMLADLALNRYDMVCVPFFETPNRAREGDFTMPIFYSTAHLFVRKDDTRFDNNFERANRPDIKLAALDGEFSSIGAAETFPKATLVTLPALSANVDLYMTVAGNKADAVMQDPYTFANYNATNPGIIRPAAGPPLRVVATGMLIPANEPAFKAMLNTTLAYLHDSGFIDKTLKKYEGAIKSLRVAKPYALPEETTP